MPGNCWEMGKRSRDVPPFAFDRSAIGNFFLSFTWKKVEQKLTTANGNRLIERDSSVFYHIPHTYLPNVDLFLIVCFHEENFDATRKLTKNSSCSGINLLI